MTLSGKLFYTTRRHTTRLFALRTGQLVVPPPGKVGRPSANNISSSPTNAFVLLLLATRSHFAATNSRCIHVRISRRINLELTLGSGFAFGTELLVDELGGGGQVFFFHFIFFGKRRDVCWFGTRISSRSFSFHRRSPLPFGHARSFRCRYAFRIAFSFFSLGAATWFESTSLLRSANVNPFLLNPFSQIFVHISILSRCN